MRASLSAATYISRHERSRGNLSNSMCLSLNKHNSICIEPFLLLSVYSMCHLYTGTRAHSVQLFPPSLLRKEEGLQLKIENDFYSFSVGKTKEIEWVLQISVSLHDLETLKEWFTRLFLKAFFFFFQMDCLYLLITYQLAANKTFSLFWEDEEVHTRQNALKTNHIFCYKCCPGGVWEQQR